VEYSALLGFISLGVLTVLMIGKALTVMEIRSQDQAHRRNIHHISEIEEDLDTSRRKYLIALKSEGVAKHRVSQLRVRLTSMKHHMEQIEMSAIQEEQRKKQEKEQALEMAVLTALGGPAHRDSHFKRVMKVITQLIDLEKQGSGEELVAAVKEKLDEISDTGMLDVDSKQDGQEKTEN